MSELKKRQRQINEKKVLNRDEVYHGALEDILLGGWRWRLRRCQHHRFRARNPAFRAPKFRFSSAIPLPRFSVKISRFFAYLALIVQCVCLDILLGAWRLRLHRCLHVHYRFRAWNTAFLMRFPAFQLKFPTFSAYFALIVQCIYLDILLGRWRLRLHRCQYYCFRAGNPAFLSPFPAFQLKCRFCVFRFERAMYLFVNYTCFACMKFKAVSTRTLT